MGGGGERGISGITYIQIGPDGMFNSIKDFPLQEHLFEPSLAD